MSRIIKTPLDGTEVINFVGTTLDQNSGSTTVQDIADLAGPSQVQSNNTQAIPYTGVELPVNPGINIGDTHTDKFDDGTIVFYTWDGTDWVVDFVEEPTPIPTLTTVTGGTGLPNTATFDNGVDPPTVFNYIEGARHDLRLTSPIIERGSDSPTDAKGAQFLHDSYSHLNGFSDNWIGALGANRSTLRLVNNGDLWSSANNSITANNVPSLAWRPTKNSYGAFHVGYFTTANIDGFGGFTFTHGHTNTNTSQLGFVSGLRNVNSGDVNFILGGQENINSATYGGVIAGTRNNNSNSVNSIIVSGVENINLSSNGGIFSGISCYNSGTSSTIFGGFQNRNENSNFSSILCGINNINRSNGSLILTGNNNINNTVLGGNNDGLSFIGSGNQCTTSDYSYYSAILSGLKCTVKSAYSVNLNGANNTTNSYAQISGGAGNVEFSNQNPIDWASTDLLESIGNTLDVTDRSNCRTVLKNGKTQINTDGIAKNEALVRPQASLHIVSSTEGVILTPMTQSQVNVYLSTLNLTSDINGIGGNPNYSKRITVECTDCTSLDGSTLGVTLKIYPNAAGTAWVAKKLW